MTHCASNKPFWTFTYVAEKDFQGLPVTPEEFGKLQKSEEQKKIELETKKVSKTKPVILLARILALKK